MYNQYNQEFEQENKNNVQGISSELLFNTGKEKIVNNVRNYPLFLVRSKEYIK